MSKTMEFWRRYIEEHPETGYKDIDSKCIDEMDSKSIFLNCLVRHGYDIEVLDHADIKLELKGQHATHISVVFDMDADFQYFVISRSTHDGTLSFTISRIVWVISQILNGTTYYEPCGKPLEGSHITYTIGNFIVITETGDFGTNEKPWLHQRDTILLPVKYEVEGEKQ